MIQANTNAEQGNAAQEPLSACAGLPLMFEVDGKRQGNTGKAQQVKAMAASFNRMLSNFEPQVLRGCCSPASARTRLIQSVKHRVALLKLQPGRSGFHERGERSASTLATHSIEASP